MIGEAHMKKIKALTENWLWDGIVLVKTDGREARLVLIPIDRSGASPLRRDDKTVHVLMSIERLATFADDIKKLIDHSANGESSDQLQIHVSPNGNVHSGLVEAPSP